MDLSKICDVELKGIDGSDYPDFSDAHIIAARIEEDGKIRELTEEELDEINTDGNFIYEKVMKFLF